MKNFLTLLISCIFAFSVFAKPDCLILSEDNTLVLDQGFSSRSIGKLMRQATKMDANLKSGYPICLVLYTPGGSIQKGLELFDFFSGLNRPVHTLTLFAASMGFQAVQHLGKRYITRYGILMAHKARGGVSGEFGDGLSSLDSRYGMWLRRIDMMDKITVKRTKGKHTLTSFRAAYANELWLNGGEALKGGFIDAVIVPKCQVTLKSGTREIDARIGPFLSIKVIFSGCPLNRNILDIRANIATNRGQMEINEFIENNGQFGNSCNSTDEQERINYRYGNSVVKNKPAGLCASDKKVTFEQIENLIKEQRKHFSRDLKNHVMRSY